MDGKNVSEGFEETRRRSPEFYQVTSQPCVYGRKSDKDGVWIDVDRRDNTLGYPGNSMPSCWRHNVMRNCHFTFEEMQFIVENIESAKICGNHPPTAYNQSYQAWVAVSFDTNPTTLYRVLTTLLIPPTPYIESM